MHSVASNVIFIGVANYKIRNIFRFTASYTRLYKYLKKINHCTSKIKITLPHNLSLAAEVRWSVFRSQSFAPFKQQYDFAEKPLSICWAVVNMHHCDWHCCFKVICDQWYGLYSISARIICTNLPLCAWLVWIKIVHTSKIKQYIIHKYSHIKLSLICKKKFIFAKAKKIPGYDQINLV